MKLRPLVFLSAFSFAEILSVLLFPHKFWVIFTAILIFTVTLSLFLICKKQYLFCIFFSAIIVFSALNPYLSYTNSEMRAGEFIESMRGKKDIIYTATVEECRTYSSYSQIYVKLISANGTGLEFSPRARLGCFTGEKLSKGDKVIFSGAPQSVYDTKNDGFDTSMYLRSKKVFVVFPSIELISSSASESTPFFSRLKDYTEKIFFRYTICFEIKYCNSTLSP